MNPPTSVLVVDDDPLVLDGVIGKLELDPRIQVLGRALGGVEALERVGLLRPQVALVDIRMADVDGAETTRQLVAEWSHDPDQQTRVLLMTAFPDEATVESLKSGASGVILKQSAEHLAEAVCKVGAGEGWIDQSVAHYVLRHLAAGPGRRGRREHVGRLAPRERDVLTLMAEGLYNEEIATRLSLKLPTVRTHITRLQTKLGTRNRVEAVRLAYRYGLADP